MTRWGSMLLVMVALGPSPVRAEPTGWPTLLSLLPRPHPRFAKDPDEREWLHLVQHARSDGGKALPEANSIARGEGPHACEAKILAVDLRTDCGSMRLYKNGTTCESPYQAYAWYQYAFLLAAVDSPEEALDALAHVEPELRAHAKELRHARAAVSALVAESRALQAEITASLPAP